MGASLIKKILGRKDYVAIIPFYKEWKLDEEKINLLLEKIQKEKGKIIKINKIEKIHSTYHDGRHVGEGIYIDSENSYLIHYKCHKKIDIEKKETHQKP